MVCNKRSFKSGRSGGRNYFNGISKGGRRPKTPQKQWVWEWPQPTLSSKFLQSLCPAAD